MGREAPKSSLNLVSLRVPGWHQRTLDFGISFSSDLQTWGPLIKTDRKAEGGPPEEVKLTDQFSTTTYPATLVKRAPCRLWQKGGKRELQLVSEQERRPRQVTGFWKQAIAIKAKTRSAMIRARLRRWGIDVALVGSGSSYKGSSSGWRKTQTAVLETMNDYTESIHSSERLSKARNLEYKWALWVLSKPKDSSWWLWFQYSQCRRLPTFPQKLILYVKSYTYTYMAS